MRTVPSLPAARRRAPEHCHPFRMRHIRVWPAMMEIGRNEEVSVVALKVGWMTEHGGHRVQISVDGTQIETPPVEHLFFYVGLGILAATEVVEWPLALLLMAGHMAMDATNRPALHQLGEALGEV